MTKVRVQDVTKELSANAGKMLENVTRMRKRSQDMLNSLRRISDGFVREEKERQEREAKEELRRQYEASASYMTAYSSEQVPDIPAAPVVEEKPAPAPEEKPEAPKAEAPKAEAPRTEEAPKAEAPKAEAPKAEAPKAEAEKPEAKPQRAAGRPKRWPC